MTDAEIIRTLERNRDANPNKPNFVESCNAAITAIHENRVLKNRCFVLSGGMLCEHCNLECHALGKEETKNGI